jgi:hypothetical protein
MTAKNYRTHNQKDDIKKEVHTQEFNTLAAKVNRTVYAIVNNHMVTLITTVSDQEKLDLAAGVNKAIDDAVENALEFMVEHDLVEVRSMPKKKKAK